MGFIQGTLKIAIAIVISVLVLSLLGGIGTYIFDLYRKKQAQPFVSVKFWSFDASDSLKMKLLVRTKLVNEKIFSDIVFSGYPDFLTNQNNTMRGGGSSLTVVFVDGDGFVAFEKKIPLNEFLVIYDKEQPKGLSYEFNEYMNVEQYSKFNSISVKWNLDKIVKETVPWEDVPIATPKNDHCEVGLSKAERLKRLAQYGKVRETGLNEFSSGSHQISFLSGAEVLACH